MTKENKVPLKEVIAAVDLGAKTLWDDLDDDQKKSLKGDLWILNRYISNVKVNNREQMEHHVLTVNEYFNKHWFTLQKHPKLLWMLLCMTSYNKEKIFYHEWIGLGKRNNSQKKLKVLEEAYPNLKLDEIELLAKLNSDDEIKYIARQLGWDEKEIKTI
jgi:hypothetical protein